MTEKRFTYEEHPVSFGVYDKGVLMNAIEIVDLLNELLEENERLKQALREELEDNGNKLYIEIFDKLFNLNYEEWHGLENKDNWYPYDWEKMVKE